MTMKNFIYLPLSALLLAACSELNPTIDRSTPDSGPVMINISPDAVRGEMLVKVSEGVTTKAGIADAGAMVEESLSNVEEIIGEARFERLFAVDPRFEQRTKAEGLDRWFCIRFDESISPDVMAEALQECNCFDVIECSLPLREDSVNAALWNSATPKTSGSIAATSPFNDPYVNQMRQWDFNNTGLVGNISSVSGADCNVYRAWELSTGSPDVIVGVFDQGVMFDHEDLAANMWVNEGEIPDNGIDDDGNGYVDDIYGWNFIDNTGKLTFSSDKSHGTHIAGTISAVNNNETGVCGIAGGSGKGDGVKIMSLQILGASESGNSGAGTSGKIRAMKYAADNGAVVSQNSWGYSTGSISLEKWKFGVYSAYTDAIKYFIKYAGIDNNGKQVGPMAGGIVVCSAGNDATADLLHYPSCDPNVIAVASTGMYGSPASYTNYATWVTISAPGGNAADNSQYGQIYSTTIGELEDGTPYSDYGYKQGTSMATPHVSGALALAISYYWGTDHKTGLTPSKLRNALISSSKDVNQYCSDAYRGKMGIGSLDTYALLRAVKVGDIALPAVTISKGEKKTIDLSEYFISNNAFTVKVKDSSIASLSISRGILTVTGLACGTTTATVSDAKATEKELSITVK